MLNHMKKPIAILLAILLTLSFAACGAEDAPAETGGERLQASQEMILTTEADPAETTTEVTAPAETDPDITQPTETEPAVTEPSVTEPEVTEPATTEPEDTDPVTTEPPTTTVPPVTDPSVTVPSTTDPPETIPDSTILPVTPVPPAEETTPTLPSVTDTTCSHKSVIIPAAAPTCTASGKSEGSKCSKCGTVLVTQVEIPATGHTAQTVAGKAPTATSAGLTAGKSCSVCSAVLAKQVTVPSYAAVYNDDYYYTQLASESNGAALQKLYQRIDEEAMSFHFDTSRNAAQNVAFSVPYSDLGISAEDVARVWVFYRNDHPLYYWISREIQYSDRVLYVIADEEYAAGTDRAKINTQLTAAIKKYMDMVAGETSEYYIALILHDAVIQAIDYARDPATNYPEDDAWAHNIIGVLDGKGAVCEGYARTYQLLLNAAGVENIYVTGTAGYLGSSQEAHAWNMAQMDDGNWYWFDLTWDDTPGTYLGICYQFFCVNDTQNTIWSEGGFSYTVSEGFTDSHIPYAGDGQTAEYAAALPARSSQVFSACSKPVMRTVFTVNGFTYLVNGAKTVQLTKIVASGTAVIPETVTYKGITFTVTAAGGLDENGFSDAMTSVTAFQSDPVAVSIPKTVAFIWDHAFNFAVTGFTVAADNPYFTSRDGVLYTKSLYTLVRYPSDAAPIDCFVIPDETHIIAYHAFPGNYGQYTELVIGKNVEVFGVPNWGLGYPDEPSSIFMVILGGLSHMRSGQELTTPLTISVHPENTHFAQINGLIYSMKDGQPVQVVAISAGELVDAVILEGVTKIGYCAFNGVHTLKSITIPITVTEFGESFAVNCELLRTIYYGGTMEQWKALGQETGSHIRIVCTDGTL